MSSEEQNEGLMNGAILLDFWSKSCRPCIAMEPILKSVLKEYPEIKLLKIDVETEPNLGSKFGVKGIPMLIFLQSGKEKGRLSGGQRDQKLKEFIEECLTKS